MNPLIQKALQEFDGIFLTYLNEHDHPQTLELCKTFLTTALEEAILVGLEMAEGAVPGKMAEENQLDYAPYATGFVDGANNGRTETLARLAALKKEVMGGEK